MSYILSRIAGKVSKHTWLKTILSPMWRIYLSCKKKIMNRLFLSNAKDVMALFNDIMNQRGCHYTLAFGTLLGAIREKGFIRHDLDIDVFMWNEEWSDKLDAYLSEAGFKRTHTFTVEKGAKGREETYEFKGVSIDIFYIYPAIDSYPYCCDFLSFPGCYSFQESMKKHSGLIARRIELPIEKDIITVPFEGLQMPVPSNYKQILTYRYGPDYMIPNPNWAIDSYDNHIRVWEGCVGEFCEGD